MTLPVPSLTAAAVRRVHSLQAARTKRAERQQLRAELDSYRTEADRLELDAILTRHSSEQIEQLASQTGRRYLAA